MWGLHLSPLGLTRCLGTERESCPAPCGELGVKSPLSLGALLPQELKPKSLDVRQEELGALVDKEMAATSLAIEEAVRRIEVGPVPSCTTRRALRGCTPSARDRQPVQGWTGGSPGAAPSAQPSPALPVQRLPQRPLPPLLPPPSRLTALSLVQDMMNQARHASSGVKLEVNER